MARSVEIARAFITLEAETKGLDQQLSQAEKSLGRMATFIKAHPYAAATALGTAAITAGIQLARMAEETNRAIGVIATRVPDATGKIDQLRSVVNRLAIEYGIAQDQVIETMDAASRAGVSNAKELEQVAEAAIRTGKVLGQNGATLIEGLDAALDIFGIAGKDATAVMIQFFAAAEGRTSVDDLLASVTKLAPAIAGTGLDLVTTTNALAALIDEGFEPGKKLIAEFAERLKNEGVPAIQALSDRVAGTGGAVEAMDKYSAALAKNTTDIESNIQRGQSELKASLLELGTALQPVIAKLSLAGAAMIQFLNPANRGVGALLNDAREKADAAAKSTDNAAASMDRLGKTGGIASGEIGKLTATLIEAKGATDELGSKSVADLKRYESALKEANKQGKLDEAGKKSLIAVTKELDERRTTSVTVAKKNADKMDEIQKLANKTSLELLSATQREYEALTAEFQDKMQGLSKADYAKAEALLVQAQKNLLLKWAGFGASLETQTANISRTTTQDMISAGSTVIDFTEILRKHGKQLSETQQRTIESALAWVHFKDAAAGVAGTIRDGADALGAMLDSLGLSTEQTRALTAGIGDLAAGIERIASATTTGDIFGGIAGGIAGLSTLAKFFTGESASARSLRLALEKNREALEDNSRTIGDLIEIQTPGGKLAKTQEALEKWSGAGGGMDINKALASVGLLASDLDAIAKDLGLTIRNDKGQLMSDLVFQLLQAIRELAPTKFRDDFQGGRARLRAETDLFGLSPQEVAERLIQLAGGPKGSGAFGEALAGSDLSTTSGRNAARAAIQALFQALPEMGAAGLGGLSGRELLDVLTELMALLESAGIDTEKGPDVMPDRPPVAAVVAGWTEAIEAGAFPPSLEVGYWDKALELDTLQLAALDGILAAVSGPPVAAPPLPPGVLGGGTSAGRGGTTIGDVHITIQSSGNPEADGRAAGRAFVDQIAAIDELLGRRAQSQQRFSGSVGLT